MSDKLGFIIKIVLWSLMGISIIFAGMFYFGPQMLPKDYDIAIVGIAEDTNIPAYLGWTLTWNYILLFLAGGLALLFPLVFFNIKKTKGMVIGVGALVVVLLVSYMMAGSEVFQIIGMDSEELTPNLMKQVGTGLNMMYLLLGLAFLSIIYVEIAKMFK